ncbi:MAG: hypothetical protein ACXADA_01590 [Candidatus Hodarchaeales archaeon]
MKVVSFFSATTGSNKAEFCINFGYTMAKDFGKKVLIVEVDPYSPKLWNVYLKDEQFVSPEEWSNNYLFEGKKFDQLNKDQIFLKPKVFEHLDLYFFPMNPDYDPFSHVGDYTFGIDQIFITRPFKLVQQIENWNYFDLVLLILPSRFSILSSGFFLVNDAIIITTSPHNISSVKIEDFNESLFAGIRVGMIVTNANLPYTLEDLDEQQIAIEKECFLPVLMTVPRLKSPNIYQKFRILDVEVKELFKKITDRLHSFIYDDVPQQLKTSVTSKPLSLMIIQSSGLPCFWHIFEKRQNNASWNKKSEHVLVGGSMVGVQAVIAKITGSDEPLRTIDSGQIKLLIEEVNINNDKSIFGILWTTADDDTLRKNLKDYCTLFVQKYQSSLLKKMVRQRDFSDAYKIFGETFFANKPKTIHAELMKKIESFAADKQMRLSEETFRLFVQYQILNDMPNRNLLLAEYISKHNERHMTLISNGLVPTEEEIMELERAFGASVCKCVLVSSRELAPLDAITLLQLKTDETKEIAVLIIEKETVSLEEICETLGMDELRALTGIEELIKGNYIRKISDKDNMFSIED